MAKARPNIQKMTGYIPGEQPGNKKIIKLNTNENPYPPSPAVKKSIDKLSGKLGLYPDPLCTELKETAAKLYGLNTNQVLPGNGSDDCLTIIVRTFLGQNDCAVWPQATYSLYKTLCEIQDCQYDEVPFPEDFSFPAKALLEKKAKVYFIANPNSPSGTFTPVDQILDFASKTDGLVVVDEAYADFAEENCLSLIRAGIPNILILRTLSKSYSLAGLRVGLALGHPDILAEMQKVKDSYNLGLISQAGAVAALSDQEYFNSCTQKIKASRAKLTNALLEKDYTVFPSQANFIYTRPPTGNGQELFELLKENGIFVRWFDKDGMREWLRISIGTDEEMDAVLKLL